MSMNEVIKDDIIDMLDRFNDFDNSHVALTGANSFLLSYFMYFLLERNRQRGADIRITALVHSMDRARARFAEYLDDDNLRLIPHSVGEAVKFEASIDYAIHAASPAGIFSRQENQLKTFLVNVDGCRQLLDLCVGQSLRKFLFVSSVDVYGAVNKEGRLGETDSGTLDTLYPRYAYANGKRAAETLCSLYHVVRSVPAVIVRPFQVYGPGMNLTDGRLHGDFIGQILREGRIVLKSDGMAQRSFMYIKDATQALMTCLTKGVSGEAYNICDESGEMSVAELAQVYAEACAADVQVIFDMSQRHTKEVTEAPPSVMGSSAKLRGLGFSPSVSLDAGIRRTLRSYGVKTI